MKNRLEKQVQEIAKAIGIPARGSIPAEVLLHEILKRIDRLRNQRQMLFDPALKERTVKRLGEDQHPLSPERMSEILDAEYWGATHVHVDRDAWFAAAQRDCKALIGLLRYLQQK